ncbi:MAG: type 1 glutamine amidotransferase [Bryobacterales bacterium]|nr:type 1 glutamine amidotransferase [Bryobacterales bacterium]
MPTSGSILVLRHEPFEHLGYFADILQEHSIPFEYSDLGDDLDLAGRSGLIVMGGPQSANDPLPALAAELRLIAQAIRTGIPVLGICLGSQLIAKALGARVYRNPEKEIGWAPLYFTEAAQQDPLFSGIPSPTTFFHWHGETFDLPAGAEWLAYSDRCRNQAFRHPGNVYGIQFHPEITPAMIEDWSAQPVNCGDVEDLPGPIDPHAFDTATLARRVLHGWLREAKLL